MKPKKQSNPRQEDDPQHQLFEATSLLKNAEEAALFLNDLCTPAELHAMSDRWRVIELIKQGVPYRTIYDETGVSVTTIGRVARHLEHGSGGYNLIYERVKKRNGKSTQNRRTKKRETQ